MRRDIVIVAFMGKDALGEEEREEEGSCEHVAEVQLLDLLIGEEGGPMDAGLGGAG